MSNRQTRLALGACTTGLVVAGLAATGAGCASAQQTGGFDTPAADASLDTSEPIPDAPSDAPPPFFGDAPNLVGDGGTAPVQGGILYPPHPVVPSASLSAGLVPANAETLFGQAQVDPSLSAPALVYPTPGTMFPPNMADILFQWRAAYGSVYWIHFSEGTKTLDVYTDGRQSTCDQAGTGGRCWQSTADDLMLYFGMASDAGNDVTFSIASLDMSRPTTIAASPTYTVHIARTDITGAVYYWSTTKTGIRRGTFAPAATADGGVPATPARPVAPIDYITNAVFPPTTDAQHCAACHTLSRKGHLLSVALDGDVLGILAVVPVAPPPMSFGPPTQGFAGSYIGSSWSTFSDDETKIVTATRGVMTVREVGTPLATSGSPLGADGGVIALPDNVAGSMPDWAPDSNHLVFASTPTESAPNWDPSAPTTPNPNSSYGRHLYGSSIAMLSADGAGFHRYEVLAQSTLHNCPPTLDGGAPEPAYTPGARETYANPMFSGDSKWLVFSRAECESEEDPTAEIILAPAAANAPQNHLVTANRQVGASQVVDVTNGMPVWGPTNDPKISWIAFTSTRDYGLVLTPGSNVGSTVSPPFPGSNVRQLWIAAIDLTKLAAGDVTAIDPSYPAFRFSAQDLTENNHRPFWTVDVLMGIPIVPAPAQ